MLWGLDMSKEGVNLLSDMSFKYLICGDVEEMGTNLRKENCDIILAGEIIAHVANPGAFLKTITGALTEKTEFILRMVDATGCKQFLHAMLRQKKVHDDHNYYFFCRTIKQLLEKFNRPYSP